MQIQFNTGVCTILLVKVPEDARNFIIRVSEKVYPGNNILCYQTPERWDKHGKENWDWETRSEANLTFIGLSHDLNEEQCHDLVKSHEETDYPDYGAPVSYIVYYEYDTAKETFEALLIENKVYNVNPYTDPEERFMCRDCADCDGTCCNEELIKFCDPDIHEIEWKEAQERTGTWAVLRLEE